MSNSNVLKNQSEKNTSKICEPLEERINKIKGNYKLISPYHKKKKYLPFIVLGRSFVKDYQVSCETVFYRGLERQTQNDNYKIETLEEWINTGFLIKD